ncbi:MAG: hypothetical protein ACXV3A_00445 [Kineosporiaceae bacterium]
MRALMRHPSSVARLAALAVAVAGAALVLLGMARATIWAPSAVTTIRVAGQPGAPIVDTTPEVLALDGPSVRAQVRAPDPSQNVFVGVGRAGDVEAYLAGVARREVTGVGGDRARLAAAGSDTSLPDPAGVDVWALSSTGRGSATLTWPQEPGRWRLVAAVDGATPPAEVVLSWQRGGGSSSTPVVVAMGVLVLVLGLVGVRATARRGEVAAGTGVEASQEPAPRTGRRKARGDGETTPDTGPDTRPDTGPEAGADTDGGSPGDTPGDTAADAFPVGRRRLRLDVRDRPDGGEDVNDTDEPDEAPAPAPFRQERRP